jgi:predicted NBD/HSP70 family sugar kinase
MIEVDPKYSPTLDKGFIPAKLWNDAYRKEARKHSGYRELVIRIGRPDGRAWVYRTPLLPDESRYLSTSLRYLERLMKTLLWAWGGHHVEIAGAPDLVKHLSAIYSVSGARRFDFTFMGQTCFLSDFQIEAVDAIEGVEPKRVETEVSRDVSGCRIGFDLGGSDRKCAALIEGEVVFSEEIKRDPYFQSDPNYHLEGIRDSLRRAAEKLPRVDAIGGSAAGIYVENEPRVASLFRGVSDDDFQVKIRSLFHVLQKEWGDIPFVVENDGDVTALAGAMSLGSHGVLGVSMGTSEAAGYIDGEGAITGWLNELAFAPVDYRIDAPSDEWSGDAGCGVQYFSQQAVGRLIPASGLRMSADMPLPEQLEAVQAKMKEGDERAAAIYKTIGTYFGYTVAHYADFYEFEHLLFLGRVSSGEGGCVIQETAENILADEFPELGKEIALSMPDEKMKRHGQAVAAASLPVLKS